MWLACPYVFSLGPQAWAYGRSVICSCVYAVSTGQFTDCQKLRLPAGPDRLEMERWCAAGSGFTHAARELLSKTMSGV